MAQLEEENDRIGVYVTENVYAYKCVCVWVCECVFDWSIGNVQFDSVYVMQIVGTDAEIFKLR